MSPVLHLLGRHITVFRAANFKSQLGKAQKVRESCSLFVGRLLLEDYTSKLSNYDVMFVLWEVVAVLGQLFIFLVIAIAHLSLPFPPSQLHVFVYLSI